MSKTKTNNNFIITAIVLIVSLIFFSTFKSEQKETLTNTQSKKNSNIQQKTKAKKTQKAYGVTENLDSNSLTKLIQETPKDPKQIVKEAPPKLQSKRAPIDIKKIPDDLPEDLKKQLLSPAEIPEELQAQINAPRGEVPEDIKNALKQPAKQISADEVNNLPDELLE